MRSSSLVLAAVAACAVIATAAATAARSGAKNGGDSIANAAPLPIGTEIRSGAFRVKKLNNLPWASEYWRASMSPGDRLVLDYGATNQLGVGVCVLSPDVTDYTEQGASCLSSAITSAQTEMRFTAPVRGSYTIRFAVNACACTDPLSYQFVARLVEPTRLILHSPKLVRRGAHIHVSGVVTGGVAGNVALRLSGPMHVRKIV